MKAKLIALLAILLACVLILSYDIWPAPTGPVSAQPKETVRHDALPAFNILPFHGPSRAIRALPEKGILLNFWASWCAPCLIELPSMLKRVAESHGQLALVAVSIDDDRDAMKRTVARLDPKDRAGVYWVWDQNKTISLKLFNTSSVPETILIDRNRLMVDKVVGGLDWNSADIRQRLDALIGSAP